MGKLSMNPILVFRVPEVWPPPEYAQRLMDNLGIKGERPGELREVLTQRGNPTDEAPETLHVLDLLLAETRQSCP
ncbi:MAG: hypothetical protein ACE5KQ_05340, partial [Thermoplasmata archaeon]